ncbi:MAG: hypothetical protein ACI4D4_01770 [Lachnospira sp.]
MTIETMIERLQVIQKNMPGAIMKYGDITGPDISPIIICSECMDDPKLKYVCLADSKVELEMMFNEYYNKIKHLGVSEEDFYIDLLENFSLEDVKKYIPKKYEYAKNFCEKHGLV